MSTPQKIVVGFLICGWVALSVHTTIWMNKMQTVSSYCGKMVGKYASSSRSSAPDYYLFQMKDKTVSVYDHYIAQNHNVGDQFCVRERYMDIYGASGPMFLLSTTVMSVNLIFSFCFLCIVVYRLWKLLGRFGK